MCPTMCISIVIDEPFWFNVSYSSSYSSNLVLPTNTTTFLAINIIIWDVVTLHSLMHDHQKASLHGYEVVSMHAQTCYLSRRTSHWWTILAQHFCMVYSCTLVLFVKTPTFFSYFSLSCILSINLILFSTCSNFLGRWVVAFVPLLFKWVSYDTFLRLWI